MRKGGPGWLLGERWRNALEPAFLANSSTDVSSIVAGLDNWIEYAFVDTACFLSSPKQIAC